MPVARRALALHLAATLLALAPAAAWACRPQIHDHVEPTLVRTERGAASWQLNTFEVYGVGPARELGAGVVAQDGLEGHWCAGERSLVVSDCRTGEAVAVGGAFAIMGDERQERILADLEALLAERIRLGHPPTIAEVGAMARHAGVEFVVPMRADATVEFGGHPVPLEACRVLHPELAGGG